MGSIFRRGTTLYAKVKAIDGAWKRIRTPFEVGQEREARALVAKLERDVEAKRPAGEPREALPLTVARYAEQWLTKRKNRNAATDRTRVEKHALPKLGAMLLADVRPRHLRDLITGLREAGALAPASIRQVSGLLHTMFKSAQIEELIATNPVVYERGVLPKKVDKDPTWRHEAIYTRAEVEELISDDRLIPDRRMLYALKSLAALRHGEAAELTWSQYDAVVSPLGALNLGQTKSGVPRRMPVHPTLALLLAEWKLSGWSELYGRAPKPADLIVPTRNLTIRDANESQRQLVADLELLGMRVRAGKHWHRRGHDLRRTFVTLARTDGANKDTLRWTTHGPRPAEMMDLYSSFDWPALCAEVAKLKIGLRTGELVPLRVAAAASDDRSIASEPARPRFSSARWTMARGPSVVQAPEVTESTTEYERPRRDSKGAPLLFEVTGSQRLPDVATRRVSPNDSGALALDQAVVQADAVAIAVEGALSGWRADRDPRRLRRELLRVLADLERDE